MTILIIPTSGCPMDLRCNKTKYIEHNQHKLIKWSQPFKVSPELRRRYPTWDCIGKIVDIWCRSLRKDGSHPNIEIFVDNNKNIPINIATFGTYLDMVVQEPTGLHVPDLSRVAPTPHGNITISISDNEFDNIAPKNTGYIRPLAFTDESFEEGNGYIHTNHNDRYLDPYDYNQYTYEPPRPVLTKYTQRRVKPYYNEDGHENSTISSCFCSNCLKKKMPFTMANL
jgi:hypothetical protein